MNFNPNSFEHWKSASPALKVKSSKISVKTFKSKMCCDKPHLWCIPLSAVLTSAVLFIYFGFMTVFGPLSYAQESTYYLFLGSKFLTLIFTLAATYVVARELPDLSWGGSVVFGLTISVTLGLISSTRLLREPTNEEMIDYLVQNVNDPRHQSPVSIIKYIQTYEKCCGITGYEDYLKEGETTVDVPVTCCKDERAGCGKKLALKSAKSTMERIYVKGCFGSNDRDEYGIGSKVEAVHKVARSIPICSVIMDLLVLIMFTYDFRYTRRQSFRANPNTIVTFPSGDIYAWLPTPAVAVEGPVKKPQPIPLVSKDPYRLY